jgi:hypothetical protein
MEQSKQIIWQKWADPFGSDIEDGIDFDPYVGDYEEDVDDDDDDDDQINENIKNNLPYLKREPIKVIATPMGIIPVNDNTMSGKIFNFWVGHTNFNITNKIADIIEKTDGVETLNIFTRYRFRVGVGKAFDDSTIMRLINSRIYRELNNA